MGALRDQALSLTATLAGLDRAIETAGEKLVGFEGLTSIKGIGARSAAVLLSGKLKSIKIGTRRLITIDALKDWLQQNEQDPTA
ncbi:hypothetical protein [Kiloniella sp.]|uniref:hypothetical protein n=1 Tax=Kiloniella sp. TaxID=1938587 RepID=UPI003B014FEE